MRLCCPQTPPAPLWGLRKGVRKESVGRKEQEGRCLSCHFPKWQPISPAFLQLCLLIHRLEVHLPPLVCSEGEPAGWGHRLPHTLGLGVLAAKTLGRGSCPRDGRFEPFLHGVLF